MNFSQGTQNVNSRPSPEELEQRLLDALGIPNTSAKAHIERRLAGSDFARVDLRALNGLIVELQREASMIGSIPQNYPRHIDFIMRGVAALLPWYTRPLREHSQKSSRAIAALAEVVSQLVVQQREFEESNRSRNATEGGPPIA